MFKRIKYRVPDVVLVESGKTTDGKPMFNVENIASIPPVVVGKKGEKQNLPQTEVDEFGITRPVRLPWLSYMYGSVSDYFRRK
jgi:hypothetical protein